MRQIESNYCDSAAKLLIDSFRTPAGLSTFLARIILEIYHHDVKNGYRLDIGILWIMQDSILESWIKSTGNPGEVLSKSVNQLFNDGFIEALPEVVLHGYRCSYYDTTGADASEEFIKERSDVRAPIKLTT